MDPGDKHRDDTSDVDERLKFAFQSQENVMPKFRILTPVGLSFSNSGGGYSFEMEALEGFDAEILECPTSEEGFIAACKGVDAVYAKGMKFTRAMIGALDKCKLIALGTVGVDYVEVAAATEKGIPVTNCPDTFIEEVADHAMMLLLATHRRAIEQDRMVREGRWTEGRPQLLQVPRLMGQTLGFIAFGRVARAVAERAKPFGLRLMAFDPFLDELTISSHGVQPAILAEVLSQSDFVSMHLPATPEAVGFLKEQHFRQMKKNAIFINTGRGPTVTESALIKALQEKWIAGAGLDVLQVEPVKPDNPILKIPHVILSPHNASASARFDAGRRRRVGQELALVLSGRWPMSCVNPTVLPASGLRRWQPVSMERGPNS
jgi:D-3-phosphoglycerate dehydrogenase / 2-oxoglutarate reductase